MAKKFDICLMNPPYGSVGGDTIHLKFVEKCNEVSNKNIVVMPFTFVTKLTNKVQNKFKEPLSKTLISVDEVDGKIFKETAMANVAVYNFDINKPSDSNITINYINGNSESLKSLSDKSNISDYEKQIFDILEKNGSQEMNWGGGHSHTTAKSLRKINPQITDKEIEIEIEKEIRKESKHLKKYNDKVFLVVNYFNGAMNGKVFTSKNGDILFGYKNIENELVRKNVANGYNLIIFNSIKEAENCKIALQNSLLRFTIYKNQEDQSMTIKRTYKYIPLIDWSDDRVRTDEGLLEVCGCPKDKCKEYAEYCKKIIEKVDNGERP